MKPTLFALPATLAFGLMSAQFAAASTTTLPKTAPQRVIPIEAPPPEGSVAEAAQLQREHERAVAAGDHENDPFNTASSDILNQRELARAMALGNAPTYSYAPETTMPRNTPVEGLPATDDPSMSPDSPPPPDESAAGTVPPMPDTTPPDDDSAKPEVK